MISSNTCPKVLEYLILEYTPLIPYISGWMEYSHYLSSYNIARLPYTTYSKNKENTRISTIAEQHILFISPMKSSKNMKLINFKIP